MKGARGAAKAALLAAAVIAAYAPVVRAGFWDDDILLTHSPLIRAADGLGRFWLTTQAPDYWPMTSTTFWLEWRLWGAHALGYHLVNVALLVLASGLLWSVLARLKIPGAWIAAVLFALHPLNVESVAWIAQRKNLLALLFFLGSLFAFVSSEEARADLRRSGRGWYALSLLAFVLSLLSKGSTLPLPCVLLGIIAWRRGPARRDLLRLIPFAAVACVFAAVNVWFQQHGPLHAVRPLDPWLRLLAAPAVAAFYLLKSVWPVGLSFIYPSWQVSPREAGWWLIAGAAAGLTAWLWRSRNSWSRPYLAAWAYFLVMISPVLGLVDVYFMKYAPVADHYAQLALIGPAALAGSLLARTWKGVPFAIAVLLGSLTARQVALYQDNATLMRATLAHNPGSWIAHYVLGMDAAERGDRAGAIAEYREAIDLDPSSAEAHNNLGDALLASGRGGEARQEFAAALQLRPDYAEAHNNLGNELKAEGRFAAAAAEEEAALKIRPDYPAAHNNLGAALEAEGERSRAAAQYEEALRLDPELVEAHTNLAGLLARVPGREADAAAHYRAALAARPNDAILHNNFGALLASLPGREPDAIAQYEAALRLRPDYADARFNLGTLLARHPERRAEAIAMFEAVLRLNPADAQARQYLETLRSVAR